MKTITRLATHQPLLLSLMLLLAFLGFLDATYLTISHYKNVAVPCSVTQSCETVLTSTYATIAGVPIALIGALYFLCLLVFLLYLIDRKPQGYLVYLLHLSGVSFIISLFLVYLQGYVLQAYCQYCLLVEGINTVLFGLALLVYRSRKQG